MDWYLNSDMQKQFSLEITPEEAMYLYCLLKNHASWDDSLAYALHKKIETIIYNSYSIQELEAYLDRYTAICKDVEINEKK